MAEQKDSPQQYQPKVPTLAKPQFIKVGKLIPASVGFNVNVKVVSKKTIRDRENLDGTRLRIAEAIVGDDSGCVILSLRNDQIDEVDEGDTLVLRNGKIDMVNNGYMRVAIDRWGLITKSESALEETVNKANNLSEVEYELVNEKD